MSMCIVQSFGVEILRIIMSLAAAQVQCILPSTWWTSLLDRFLYVEWLQLAYLPALHELRFIIRYVSTISINTAASCQHKHNSISFLTVCNLYLHFLPEHIAQMFFLMIKSLQTFYDFYAGSDASFISVHEYFFLSMNNLTDSFADCSEASWQSVK